MSDKESPEKKFLRDGKLEGQFGLFKPKTWQLTKKAFTIEGQPPIAIKDITHVSSLDKVYRFWTDGIEPAFKLDATTDVRGVARILEKHIAKRIAKGENLSCNAPTGRLLSSSHSSHAFVCNFIGILLLAFAICIVGTGFSRMDTTSWIATILIAILALGLFFIARIKRPRLNAYENEIEKVGFFGNRASIKHADLEGCSFSVTKVKQQSGGTLKTKTKISVEGADSKISFNDPNGDAKKPLQSLERFVTETLAVKFWHKIESGENVPFGKSSFLTPTGLQMPDGTIVSYDEIGEVRFIEGEGKAQLFLKNGQKPALKIKAKEKNFLPGYQLLTMLADPSITYKERCGKAVIPIYRTSTG